MDAGKHLAGLIQQQVLPKRKPLKVAGWTLLIALLFVSDFAFAQFLTIPHFGPFLTESKPLCELAKGQFNDGSGEDNRTYCIFWK